jgi:1,4-dihydroxy-2-naphthoyl-CoA synthase
MKVIFLALATLMFFSCTPKPHAEVIPGYVLDKEKFSKLICDFTLAESAASINIKNARADKLDSVYGFDPLIENGIDRKTFDTSLYFYCRHPVLFKEVYQMSMEKLSRLQSTRK